MKRAVTTASVLALSLLALSPVNAQSWTQLAASAGLTAAEAQGMTLNEIYAAKINRESGRDGQQLVSRRATPTMVVVTRDAQLIAAAGLTPEEAQGMTLAELASHKTSFNARHDERQVVVSSRSIEGIDPSAHRQLVAAAGITDAEALGVSLNDLYVLKINKESRRDDSQSQY
jgi:hypothetical protein